MRRPASDHQWTLERAAESHPEKAAYLNWIDPEAVVLGEEKQARMTQGTSKYATVRPAISRLGSPQGGDTWACAVVSENK